MTAKEIRIDNRDWFLLIVLSVLWAGSYFFAGVAVKELPPLTIVLARVGLAAAVLAPVHWMIVGRLPSSFAGWLPFIVMALLNNVIPFSLIVSGQTQIASGLASVLNATTPLFTALVLGFSGDEKLVARRILGVATGIAGVAILRGASFSLADSQAAGTLMCLGAALSYGFAGLWARRRLGGVAPLTSATCQLVSSSAMMLVLAGFVEQPWLLAAPSFPVWAALIGFAVLSTALAYIVFFNILERSGASNVMLVTLLIPVTAILLGHFVLGEPVIQREIIGALVIASSLLIIDGRLPRALANLRRDSRPRA